MKKKTSRLNRREFLRKGLWTGCLAGLAGTGTLLGGKSQKPRQVWQIDPDKCTACGKCATTCVLQESAVKSVHAYALCGYCDLCMGYFSLESKQLTTAAENQLCPRGAIQRTCLEDPYFEYSIDEGRCNGCARCVNGCSKFGNGSLFLQIRHDRCVNCNDCAIVAVCPGNAIVRVGADQPYLLREPK